MRSKEIKQVLELTELYVRGMGFNPGQSGFRGGILFVVSITELGRVVMGKIMSPLW